MRRVLVTMLVLSLSIGGSMAMVRAARADGDSASPEEVQRARQSLERMQREIRESEAQEKHDGAIARQRLAKEFHVDSSKMSDGDAIRRLHDEVQARDAAKEAAEQRQREQAEARREKQIQDTVKKQDAIAQKAYGMNTDEVGDDEDAAEASMYEQMVQHGVAPQCRGKKGRALIDCVDAALGE